MALRYMLDTNIVSDLIRQPQGVVADKIRRKGETTVCCSIIVAAELRYGGAKKQPDKLNHQIDIVLSAMAVLAFDEPADRQYGELRTTLASRGELIGPNDLLIAAHALSANLIIVTSNTREFNRVDGLAVENWLQP